ncbi:hypothetical protein AC1031_001509 [Aphanomyces cochlioides]|nr:hypothetical protein AC1031_001509 [Aphanomyces cochlioides]
MSTEQDRQTTTSSSHCGKFTCRHDIYLLQQVSIVRPWEADHGKLIAAWDDIANELSHQPDFGMNKKTSALKARFETIMTKFIKGEKLSRRQSGTSEDYDEREVLLTDIKSRMDDFEELAAARRNASKRKMENLQNSGQKKSKRPAPSIAINTLMESKQEAIEEKKEREARLKKIALDRLAFDREEAARQAERHESNQRMTMEILQASLNKMG